MIGIDWMADEPVPITPTRWPLKSTPSCGQRPAEPAARLEDARRQTEAAQAMEHVEPGEPRADDDCVEVRHAHSRLYAGSARVVGRPDREGSEPRYTPPIRRNPMADSAILSNPLKDMMKV